MPEYRAQLGVRLRSGVLDPAGQAVGHALRDLGFSARDVAVGKLIELTVDAASLELAEAEVRRMAAELLVNPVLEDFDLEIAPR